MTAQQGPFVLAIAPCDLAFAFVVFKASGSPIDWGVKPIRGDRKNRQIETIVADLIGRYHPSVLILEDWMDPKHRRGGRIQALFRQLTALAKKERVRTMTYTREEIQDRFPTLEKRTKRQIAEEIARRIPALAKHLPPVRKPWKSEDARMGLFEAAAVGLTFFASPPTHATVIPEVEMK